MFRGKVFKQIRELDRSGNCGKTRFPKLSRRSREMPKTGLNYFKLLSSLAIAKCYHPNNNMPFEESRRIARVLLWE